MPFTPGNEIAVNQFTSGSQTTSSTLAFGAVNERPMQALSMDANGNLVITWSSQGQDVPAESTEWGVYARRYDATTQTWGAEFRVNSDTAVPGDQLQGNQLASAVAMDDEGDFIITWSGRGGYLYDDESGYGVYAQRYDRNGTAQGGPFLVNKTTTSNQSNAAIAVDADGDFVVVWTSTNQAASGSRNDLYLRRFNQDGTPLPGDPEILVNSFTTGEQQNASVAMDANGNFVVVWESDGQDGNSWGIFAQRFSADGSKLGSEFQVNTVNTNNAQRQPSVSMDAAGNFVISWTSNQAGFEGEEVFARRYDRNGVAQGNEFKVNTSSTGSQQYSQVRMVKTGGFIVTWTGVDGAGSGIYGRRFGANGAPLPGADGSEFLVNTTTLSDQRFSAIASDGNGNFAISWTSRGQDGSSDGVYSKLYQVTATPNAAPTDIVLSSSSINENAGDNSLVGTFSTVDPDAGDTHTYELVAGEGSVDNSAFTIVGNQLRIVSSPNFEAKPAYSIRVRTTDQGGRSYEEIIPITVVNLPETPTSTTLTSTTVNENVVPNTVIGTFATSDPDNDTAFVYSLVPIPGNSDDTAFSISGNQLRINVSPNFEAKPTYTIRIRTTDPRGLTREDPFTISVANVNERPTDIQLSNAAINENVPANSIIGALTAVDPDAGDTFTYSLAPSFGDNAAFTITSNQLRINAAPDFETKPTYTIRVRATDRGGLSFDKDFTVTINNLPETPANVAPTALNLSATAINENVAAGTTVGTFTTTDANTGDTFTYQLVEGTGDTDNSAFTIVNNQLRINASPNFEAKPAYSIRVRTTDQGGLNIERAFTITVTDLNEAPTALLLAPNQVNENVPANTVVGRFSATDPDAGDTAFTYTLVSDGTSTDNSAFTIVGNELRINSIPDFETKSRYSILARVTDRNGTGLSFTQRFTLNVVDGVDPGAPTDLLLSNSTIDENVPIDTVVGTLSSVDADSTEPFTYTLVPTFGDAASFEIVGNQLRIKTSPNFEAKPTYAIRVTTRDSSGQSFTKTLTITVRNVNEAPTALTLSANSVDENRPVGTVVGNFRTVDPDTGDTHTYTLVTGEGSADNSAFTIVGNELRLNVVPNFEAKPAYSIRVRSTDARGLSTERALTIAVNNVGEAPTDIALSANTVDENRLVGTVVGSFSSTDGDVGDTFTYSLVAGEGSADNSAFTIVGNELRLNAVPNFEAKPAYSIRVRTTDSRNQTFEKVFTVNVRNLDEAPTNIALSSTSVEENRPAGTVVGTLTAIDSDVGENHTFALVVGEGSTDNSAFTIVGNQLRLNGIPDFETKPTYSIRVRTTDSKGLSFERSFTINVTNLSELPGTTPPRDLLLSATQIDENRPAGTVVGAFSTVDPDTGDTFTYSLVAGDGSTDNSAFTIVGNQLRLNRIPDFEAKPSYSIRVRTSDSRGLAFEKTFTITVRNLPELPGTTPPRDLLLSASSIDENKPVGTVVGDFSTVDPDVGDTFTYTLVAGEGSADNSAFTIVGNQLRLNRIPDFETQSNYSIRVRTADVGNLAFEKVFQITVNDLSERPGTTPPQDLRLSSNRIDENRPAGSVVGSFSTIDPDLGDSHTYTLVAGEGSTDNAAFTIVGNQLRLNRIPDFETQSSYSIRVRTSDVNGLAIERAFTVLVNDLRERPGDTAPTDLRLSQTTVNENVPIGSVVGTLSTIDADRDDRFTYSLVPGFGDNAAFTIVDNELRTNAAVDFETKSSYRVQIITTDVGGRSFSKTLTIGVVNQNDPPIVTVSTGALAYTENAGAVPIDTGIRVSDIDSPTLTSATVRLLDYVAGQDRLSFTPQTGITGTFDAANGVLTFSGTASIASYQTLLRSVAYTNRSTNPTSASRTVQFSVRDAAAISNLASRRIQIRAIDSPPSVTTSAGGVSYVENAGEVVVDAGVLISDADSPDLTEATVRIGGYRPNQDRLSFTPQSGISGSFDAATGVLTLTGTASIAAYQSVLRSVTYANSSGSPSTAPRTIQFSVRDRSTTSNIATRSIQITAINTAPTVTLARGPLTYTENAAAVALDSQLTLTDPDSLNLTGATVRLVGYVAGQDRLSFTPQSGIRGGFDPQTGVLNFSGIAPIGRYQTLLRSVTYRNSSENPDPVSRTLQVSVRDAAANSTVVARSLRVVSVNDAPTLQLSRQSAPFTGGQSLLLDPQVQLGDLDSRNLTGATLTLRGFVAGEDTLLVSNQTGIASRFDPGTGVLTLTGTAPIATYQAALRSVRYLNSSSNPTTTPRTVEWRVRDGADSSAPARLALPFDASSILPVLDLNGSGVGVDLSRTFVTSGPPVTLVAGDARFTNQDYPSLTLARVVISNLLDGANEALIVDTAGTGISSRYDPPQGVLSLSGRAPLSSYLQVLRSVQYQNRSNTPDTTTRTILFTLSDDNRTSVPAQATVQIAPINLVNGASSTDPSFVTTPATDLISALDGNDTVVSILSNLQQNDIIDGGAGSDTFRLLDGSGTARVEVENSINQIGGILTGNTTVTNFETFDFSGFTGSVVMVGSNAGDRLTGGRGNDQISGSGGSDWLSGNDGDDQLDGGSGNDRMDGGTGDDRYVVDSANDGVVEVIDAGFDTIQASINWTLGDHLDALTLTGRARIGVGNALDNALTGNANDNSLSGEAGDDVLVGEDGNDSLSGGSGNDQLVGGNGRDILLGGDGNDRLVGSDGRDRITGGKGKDSIVLTAARRNSLDTITDFRAIDDTLIISRSGFSPSLRLGRIARSRFVVGSRAQDRNDRFIYNRGTGVLFFDSDGAGGLGQVQIARFTNRPSLTRADIVISN